jgi:hypothetical protein
MKSNLLFYYIKECTARTSVEYCIATFVQSVTLNQRVRSRDYSEYLKCHKTLGRMHHYIKPVYERYCLAWRLPITDKGISEIIL